MCSDSAFHQGECEVLVRTHGFKKVALPAGAPGATAATRSTKRPSARPRASLSRSSPARPAPRTRRWRWACPSSPVLLVNRHAQLGSFDLKASMTRVRQQGYKLMMCSQCAGLTTRFAMSRIFPDADIYSSWDSTYFNTDGVARRARSRLRRPRLLRGHPDRDEPRADPRRDQPAHQGRAVEPPAGPRRPRLRPVRRPCPPARRGPLRRPEPGRPGRRLRRLPRFPARGHRRGYPSLDDPQRPGRRGFAKSAARPLPASNGPPAAWIG